MCAGLLKNELPLFSSLSFESCNCPATLVLYSKAFALCFHLCHCLFEGVLQIFGGNYFRWYFRNFFFFLYRMEDKGEVKCIKFSLGNKILAVQRTLKSVVRNLHPADKTGNWSWKSINTDSARVKAWDKCSTGLMANNSCSENSTIALRGWTSSIAVLLVSSFKKKWGEANSYKEFPGRGEMEYIKFFFYIFKPKQFDKLKSILLCLFMYLVCTS